MVDYADLLASYSSQSFPDEASYGEAWLKQNAGAGTLLARAVAAGLLADRMAWVFVAGYQCAMRHTFSDIPWDGLAAFAVSEDRKGTPPLPGVSSHYRQGETCVSGYKTWVACSSALQYLVIKADRGEQARYYCLPRQTPGLTLTDKYGDFLSEMSQGVAQLENVVVPQPLDASRVRDFGIRESLYIYIAFCAWAGSRGAPAADCELLIHGLAPLVETPPTDAEGLARLRDLDNAVQNLRLGLSGSSSPSWEQDQRLIAMYSPGMQKRQPRP